MKNIVSFIIILFFLFLFAVTCNGQTSSGGSGSTKVSTVGIEPAKKTVQSQNNATALRNKFVTDSLGINYFIDASGKSYPFDAQQDIDIRASIVTDRRNAKRRQIIKADSSEYELINDSTYLIKEYRGTTAPSASTAYNVGMFVSGASISMYYKVNEKTVWKRRLNPSANVYTDFVLKNGQYLPQKGYLDIKDFGAVGTGDTIGHKDQNAFNAAESFMESESGYQATIFLPVGIYRVHLNKPRMNYLGASKANTILQGYRADSTTVYYPAGNNFDNITFKGAIGIKGARAAIVKNCNFYTDSIGWLTKAGGQYNNLKDVVFNGGKYGMYLESAAQYYDDAGHAGFIEVVNARFNNAEKAGLYIKDKSLGGASRFAFCAFESNRGFGVVIDSVYANYSSIEFTNCWYEDNNRLNNFPALPSSYTNRSIYINGSMFPVTTTHRNGSIRNGQNIVFNGRITEFFVTNSSTVFIKHSQPRRILIDSTSTVEGEFIAQQSGENQTNLLSNNIERFVINSVLTVKGDYNTEAFVMQNKKPSYSSNGRVVANITGATLQTWGGSAAVAASLVKDGISQSYCNQIVATASGLCDISGFTAFVADSTKYYVTILEYKKQYTSGTGYIEVGTTPSRYMRIPKTDNKWHTYLTISNFANRGSGYNSALFRDLNAGDTMRIGLFQIIEFNSLGDAQFFANSGNYYAVTNEKVQATFNSPIAAGADSPDITATLTGAAVGDVVKWSLGATGLPVDVIVKDVRVTAANTVAIRFTNKGVSSQTPNVTVYFSK